MKLSVQYARKAGRENYGSENFSLAIETEPPAEVAQDREKLRAYVEALFAEVRARVEDQIQCAGDRRELDAVPPAKPEIRTPRGAPGGRPSQRALPNGRTAVSPARRAHPASNGHSNGHADSDAASVKQLNYLRSLAAAAGYSADQLAYLAQEVVGKDDLRALSKRDASALIDQLRDGPAS